MEQNRRLIDADALELAKFVIADESEYARGWNDALSAVAESVTVEAEPVRHGRWIDCTVWHGRFGEIRTKCSACGTVYPYNPKSRGDGKGGRFCEECGAKMDLEG